MKTPKHLFVLTGIVVFSLTSCLTHKTIVKNYSLMSDDPCDCITKHPLLVVGTQSNYFSKEKALCLRADYLQRRDSIFGLKDQKYQAQEHLEDEAFSQDSLKRFISSADASIQNLKQGWTHAKIKTKWKISVDNEVLILKQKKVFYNRFQSGGKRVGMTVYANDSLVK